MTDPDRYRYEATVRFVIAADGLDEAYRRQRQVADIILDHTRPEVILDVTASMLDLQHRPDLDNSLRGRAGS